MSIDDYKPSYNGINLSTARTPQLSQPLLTTPRKKPETLSTAPLNQKNQQNNTVVATALLERSIPAGANLIPMDNAEMKGMLLLLMLLMLMLLMLLPLVAIGCHWLPLVATGCHRSTCTHPAPFTLSGFKIGQIITIGEGDRQEERTITGFGSLILDRPLTHNHARGSKIEARPGNPWNDNSLVLAVQNEDLPEVQPPPPSHAITDEIDDDVRRGWLSAAGGGVSR
jgi:hypothetical protein